MADREQAGLHRGAGGAATPPARREVKTETQATIRCLPLEQPRGPRSRLRPLRASPRRQWAIFAKAY